MRDPWTFLSQELPALVAAGLGELRRVDGEGAGGSAALGRFDTVHEALSLTLVGELDRNLFLVLREGTVTVVEAAPQDCQVHYACVLPAAALQLWLGRLSGVDSARLAAGLVRLTQPRVLAMFSQNAVSFDLNLAAVPELGLLKVRVALGRSELPAASDFRVSAAYPDLEQARAQGMGPQQLFAAGRLKVEGDVARAMGLGMMLMQLKRMSEG